jgi:hypothetical protein
VKRTGRAELGWTALHCWVGYEEHGVFAELSSEFRLGFGDMVFERLDLLQIPTASGVLLFFS